MKTARDVVHEALDGHCGPNWVAVSGSHDHKCDRLTAAIEARDEEWNRNINQNDRDWETKLTALTAERDRLREAAERDRLREALAYANGILERFTAMTPRTMQMGRLPFTELHDEAMRYLEAIERALKAPGDPR